MTTKYATCRLAAGFVAIGILALCAMQHDNVRADEIVEAKGLLAMPVSFANDDAAKLSSAAVMLLDNCTTAQPATITEWLQAQRLCHLRLKYRDAHRIALGKTLAKVAGQDSLAIDELIVTLPLPTSGRIYIRSGDEYHWFAKWPGTETNRLCDPIQALLSSRDRTSADTSLLIEQLASPSQKTRDEAAETLLKIYTPTPREIWAPVVAKIEVGETKEKVLAQLKDAMAEASVEVGIGTGASYMESFRLDDCWLAQCWFQNNGDILREISLVERMRHVWVAPADDFSGVWITYFPNGQKSHQIDYRNGQYFGEFVAYRSDGTKSYVQHYTQDGADGEDTGYFPSGRVSYRAYYKAGKPFGTWTWFNEDGTVRTTEEKAEALPPN